jgi:hypothetical protein
MYVSRKTRAHFLVSVKYACSQGDHLLEIGGYVAAVKSASCMSIASTSASFVIAEHQGGKLAGVQHSAAQSSTRNKFLNPVADLDRVAQFFWPTCAHKN